MALSAAYLDQLEQLLPPGDALPRGQQSWLARLLRVFTDEFARLHGRADRLLDELDPRTALESLSDWERELGLPDQCSGAIAATVPERRAAITAKLTARGGQSIAYLTALAASLGFDVVITEYRPSRVSLRASDRCAGIAWAWAFRVEVLPTASTQVSWMRAGRGRVGDRIRAFGNSHLECAIRRAMPAQAMAIFAYPEALAADFLFDFTL